MTDAEWQECDDPSQLLAFVLRKQQRKLRLAAVAACRGFSGFGDEEQVANLLTSSLGDNPDCAIEEALAVAERFADGQATATELKAAEATMRTAHTALFEAQIATSADCDSMWYETLSSAQEVTNAIGDALSSEPADAFSALSMIQGPEFLIARDLREVFGPPGTQAFCRSWLTKTVLALAKVAYNEAAFDRLPILADALEDAGCDNSALLEHLRSPDGHRRGCWALDLILDKE